jgi:hypothetical protein
VSDTGRDANEAPSVAGPVALRRKSCEMNRRAAAIHLFIVLQSNRLERVHRLLTRVHSMLTGVHNGLADHPT